ncbi:Z-ring formation inhibitor MciZ [Metabacillus fastidiosus]|uniref:Z-ring formation inhibitor MciZ n=1 Tax=Metabacillus fastidiosus TaxID=1458 RepID=UPI003D2BC8D4
MFFLLSDPISSAPRSIIFFPSYILSYLFREALFVMKVFFYTNRLILIGKKSEIHKKLKEFEHVSTSMKQLMKNK